MNWQAYIDHDPKILAGKPIIKGTRLAVDFILRLYGAGWSTQEVIESYPSLTREAIQAIFAFAADAVHHEEDEYALPVVHH